MAELRPGEPTPWFIAPSASNPTFNFSSTAGRYLLLGFPPSDPEKRQQVFGIMQANIDLLTDSHIACFTVLRDPALFANARDRDGLRWFSDPQGAVSRLYGALDEAGVEHPIWVLIDPSLRILFVAPMDESEQVFARMRALPPPDEHADTPLHAPVLIVPRVFDRDLCRRLIAYYEADGGSPSGVMFQQDGVTVGVLNESKKRRDATIEDAALCEETRVTLDRRLSPEVLRAFRFRATRLERYIVACYAAEDGGYFLPHRDNLTAGTAHRQFAVSINLNAEDFEGGDLRFPEYGMRTYRPPTGGAVVFSCSLLHEATPVTRGVRYAFLPFLYDEAGEVLREKNRHLLAPLPSPPAAASSRSDSHAAFFVSQRTAAS
ncbi:MAG TPA: 2OG-Fe(II) oxygenase [Phenylobacterium sp.]|jgi:predicted 2-oxoglutarate/Fe(II)-dependent dioxygenase YbiX|uniref:2OG-Fe(II) oxygenase n=1 Tax=Phenylobacterium sp. TaxID=1871053 RepID=UPI002BEF0267|nr:2OG-Fe(II) oxygenase [Phenylobacterium sp.]HXA39008.1 2OG-Fe(II) oxygenase [Phenylobacterium sp.]